ncbi:MAG: site-specific DNA-methyltransferase, partial [Lachnospiraceae bacterium]|nr:site-specific DNA-methyltransferase [Oribacterium sp.]MBP3296638.1 site-specific DNA-methyltransferase [Lachnospiraceae bacterium]
MEGQMTFEFDQRPTIKGFPELRWTGKRPYRSTQYYPAQLRESYGEPVDGWMNKIFWGDNLQVMSHMLKEYRGKIDLIYIDPPFDSKADYKKKIEIKGIGKAESDSTSFEEKQYGDIWTNDEYLQFMYERLMLIRELLADTGVVYVHCDHRKASHIKLIADEIFGEENFMNQITWRRQIVRGMKVYAKYYSFSSDYILIYAKSAEKSKWYRQTKQNRISVEEAERKYNKDE